VEPEFLHIQDVLVIHADQIERYGGSDLVRDHGLLASAVETARATFAGQYLHRDLFEIAAAYLFHIVQNHPFVDGNKRAGIAAALVFLDLNGIQVNIDDDALTDFVLEVAQGRISKPQATTFLRQHAVEA
jgi:death-on-curing protein